MKFAELTGADVMPVLAGLVRLLRLTDTSDGLSAVAAAVLGHLSTTGGSDSPTWRRASVPASRA